MTRLQTIVGIALFALLCTGTFRVYRYCVRAKMDYGEQVGQNISAEFRAMDTFYTKDYMVVCIGDSWPSQEFNVVVPQSMTIHLNKDNKFKVSGTVVMWRGKPSIIVTDSLQLER